MEIAIRRECEKSLRRPRPRADTGWQFAKASQCQLTPGLQLELSSRSLNVAVGFLQDRIAKMPKKGQQSVQGGFCLTAVVPPTLSHEVKVSLQLMGRLADAVSAADAGSGEWAQVLASFGQRDKAGAR